MIGKPNPDQLLLACKQLNVAAANCVYVGDARSDIVAGRSAGMATIAATYGYIPEDEDPASWQADATVRDSNAVFEVALSLLGD